jgi:hypothetical protein
MRLPLPRLFSFPGGCRRYLLALALMGLHLAAGAGNLHAQTEKTLGLFMGASSSRQLWTGAGRITTESAWGPSLGIYVDVQTPAPILSIRAELGYAQRGGLIWDEELDPDHTREARVKSHYLSVPILGKLTWELGRISPYLVLGPVMDVLLHTGCGVEVCPLFREESPTAYGVTLGGGLSTEVRDRIHAGLELRVMESLSEAYVGDGTQMRNRSLEILLRLGQVR